MAPPKLPMELFVLGLIGHPTKGPPMADATPKPVAAVPDKPAKPERVPLSISIPAELAERLRKEADDRVVNVSLLVAKALEEYLPNLPAL